MFTFGRDHEKQCEARYVRNPEQVPFLLDVIDAVHDLIEKKINESKLIEKMRTAFINGGAGVWENTGKWIRKTSKDYPQILQLWSELAENPKAEVRFRVACFLDEMPAETFAAISPVLAHDKSKRVATMASERIKGSEGVSP